LGTACSAGNIELMKTVGVVLVAGASACPVVCAHTALPRGVCLQMLMHGADMAAVVNDIGDLPLHAGAPRDWHICVSL
jgi:hypothetical protein